MDQKFKIEKAIEFHKKGKLNEAKKLYEEIIEVDSVNSNILNLLGVVYYQETNYQVAKLLLLKAIQINPENPIFYSNISLVEYENKKYENALLFINKAILLKPELSQGYYNKGNYLSALNKHIDAIENYNIAIKYNSQYVSAYINCGNSYKDIKKYRSAIEKYSQAIKIDPKNFECYNNIGLIKIELKKYDEALLYFEKAIKINDKYSEAYCNIGILYKKIKKIKLAEKNLLCAISLNSNYFNAHYNYGNLLLEKGLYEDAIKSYDLALSINLNSVNCLINKGVSLTKINQINLAEEIFEKALVLDPDESAIYANKGILMQKINKYNEAIDCYDTAIKLVPNNPTNYFNKGLALQKIKKLDLALSSYEIAYSLDNMYDYLLGSILHLKSIICKWDEIDLYKRNFIDKINKNEKTSPPFAVLSIVDSLKLIKQTVLLWSKENNYNQKKLIYKNKTKLEKKKKIRIGYYSADFHDHPVGLMMQGILENHDKSKFEIIAFSLNFEVTDELNAILREKIDIYINVQFQSDLNVALLSREMEVDIAIDLSGYTEGARPNIFSYRAAPIQVNYLGYPGTMGTNNYEYIFADKILIPTLTKKYYSERVVYLPNYFAIKFKVVKDIRINNNNNFIYAVLNRNYKITIEMYEIWMKILQSVPKSILMIYADNEWAEVNLLKETEKFGIEKNRIYIIKNLNKKEYMDTFLNANLFLDTFPYNAGTTACDALAAGLPVLTKMGETFVSRMAASILSSLGLEELITSSNEEYLEVAIKIGNQPAYSDILREKIDKNKYTSSLFDPVRLTQNIENAYMQMYERFQSSLPPKSFEIEDIYGI